MAGNDEYKIGSAVMKLRFDISDKEKQSLEGFSKKLPEMESGLTSFEKAMRNITQGLELTSKDLEKAVEQASKATDYKSLKRNLEYIEKNFKGYEGLTQNVLSQLKKTKEAGKAIRVDIPDETKKKMSRMGKLGTKMKGFLKEFARGGGAFIATLGIAAFLLSGSGFRSVLSSLGSLVSMLSDLLFISLLPAIQPIFTFFKDFAKTIQEFSKGKGGIFGALLNPEFWATIGGYLVKAIAGALSGVFKILSGILEGMIDYLQHNDKFQSAVQTAWSEAVGAVMDLFKSGGKYFNDLMTLWTTLWSALTKPDSPLHKAFDSFVSTAKGVLTQAATLGWNLISSALQGVMKWVSNPDNWKTIVGWIMNFLDAAKDVWISIGNKIASGVMDGIKNGGGKAASNAAGGLLGGLGDLIGNPALQGTGGLISAAGNLLFGGSGGIGSGGNTSGGGGSSSLSDYQMRQQGAQMAQGFTDYLNSINPASGTVSVSLSPRMQHNIGSFNTSGFTP